MYGYTHRGAQNLIALDAFDDTARSGTHPEILSLYRYI